MLNRIEWKISASPFREPVKKFIQEFSDYNQRKQPYPIPRFFQIFPLNAENHDIEEEVKDRGLLTFQDGKTINEGEAVQASFRDAKIGRVSIYFAKHVEASISRAPRMLLFSNFSGVLLRLDDLPPEFGLATRFLVKGISFGEASVEYLLAQDDDPTKELLINADLTLSVRDVATHSAEVDLEPNNAMSTVHNENIRHHVLFAMAFASDGPCCTGEKGETWVIRRTTTSGICHVQMKTASPLGDTLPGEYESCADAKKAKEDLIANKKCEPE